MKEQILSLVGRHCETVRSEAMEIADLVARAGSVPDPDLRRRLIARAHRLKGSSGTIGFAEISETCLEIETILSASGARDQTPGEAGDLAAAAALLQDRARALRPEHSSLHARLA